MLVGNDDDGGVGVGRGDDVVVVGNGGGDGGVSEVFHGFTRPIIQSNLPHH